MICGFPGETAEQHETLMQFVNDMEFERLGAFTYSPEEGYTGGGISGSAGRGDQELTWKDDVMELQQEIIFEQNEELKGQEIWAYD